MNVEESWREILVETLPMADAMEAGCMVVRGGVEWEERLDIKVVLDWMTQEHLKVRAKEGGCLVVKDCKG